MSAFEMRGTSYYLLSILPTTPTYFDGNFEYPPLRINRIDVILKMRIYLNIIENNNAIFA